MTASTGSSNEGVADASFTELANLSRLVKDGKYVYVDDATKWTLESVAILKDTALCIRDNKPILKYGPKAQPPQFGTPSEAGWADPVKLGRLMDAVDQLSDAQDVVLVEVVKLKDKVAKGGFKINEELSKQLSHYMNKTMEIVTFSRLLGRTAKKAMEIRESILKGELD